MSKQYVAGESAITPKGEVALIQKPDGSLIAAQSDSSGNLKTTGGGGGGGGTSSIDGDPFVAGTTVGTPIMGEGGGTVLIAKINPATRALVVEGSTGGGQVTVADGADVVEGSLADAAVVTDANGTLSGKIRGLIVILLRAFSAVTPLRIDPTGSTTQPVSLASAPLPTGAATSALQTTGNTSIASIDAKTPALGQALAAASVPIVLTAAQITTLTPPAAITGFATETTLAAVNTKTPSLGQAAMVASVPVALASNQSSIPVAATLGAETTKVIGTVNVAAAQGIAPQAIASGGATPYQLISAASTNATSVKGSAGTVYSIAVFNLNAAQRYLKLYNKASAPTVGSDTPVATYMIPGNTAGAGLTISFPVGMNFGTGIAFALTTGIAVADAGAVAISEISVNLTYL